MTELHMRGPIIDCVERVQEELQECWMKLKTKKTVETTKVQWEVKVKNILKKIASEEAVIEHEIMTMKDWECFLARSSKTLWRESTSLDPEDPEYEVQV